MSSSAKHYLAHANIARMSAPLHHSAMAGFVAQLEYINAVAERSAGFVWRLEEDAGDAAASRAFDDERVLFNMSVWEGLEALYAYTYTSDHLAPLRERRRWFERMPGAHLVLWWVPAGHEPTAAEARQRFDLLNGNGPTAAAFTFRQAFSPAGEPLGAAGRPDAVIGGA